MIKDEELNLLSKKHFNLINDQLDSDKEKYNRNLIKYLKELEQKDKIKNYEKEEYNKEKIEFIFDDSFFDELLKDNGSKLKYYVSSFNYHDKGLDFSQLKTFCYVNNQFSQENFNKNKLIPINGGPGTGKSTIINYIISNFLFKNFWNFILNNKNDLNLKFYNMPKILVTGITKMSVKNVVDICKIEFKNRLTKIYKEINDKEKDIQKINEKISFLFNSINIDTYNNKNNTLDKNLDNKISKWKRDYLDNKLSKKEIELLKRNFLINCKIKWFNDSEKNKITEDNIVFYLIEKIKKNNLKIDNQINCIANVWNNKDELQFELEKSFLYFFIKKHKDLIENSSKTKKKIYFQNLLDFNNELKINNKDIYFNEKILFDKLDWCFSKYKNKFKLFFSSKNKIKNIFRKIYFNWVKEWEKSIFKKCVELKQFFKYVNDDEIRTINLDNEEEFKKSFLNIIDYLNNETLKENIMKIQKNLDETTRHENMVLYRTIHEWWNIFHISTRDYINEN